MYQQYCCFVCDKPASRVCIHPKCDNIPILCGDKCKYQKDLALIIHTHEGQNSFISLEELRSHLENPKKQSSQQHIDLFNKRFNIILAEITNLIDRYHKQLQKIQLKYNSQTNQIIENLKHTQKNHLLKGSQLYNMINKIDCYEDQQSNLKLQKQLNANFESILISIEKLHLSTFFNQQSQNLKEKNCDELSDDLSDEKQLAINILARCRNPTDPQYVFDVGMSLSELKWNKYAYQYFEKAIGMNPNKQLLSRCYCQIANVRQNQQAIQYYQKTSKQGYDSVQNFKKIQLSLRAHLFDQPIENITKAIQNQIENKGNLFYTRALVYFLKQQNQKAMEDINKAISYDSKNPGYYLFRGKVYLKSEDYSKSKLDLIKGMELNPEYQYQYQYLQVLYEVFQNLKRFQQGIQYFTSIINRNKQYLLDHAYNLRGLLYFQSGKQQLAYKDHIKASELKPDNDVYFYNITHALQSLNRYPQAIQQYSKSIQLNGDDASSYYRRGCVYFTTDDNNNALKDFDKAIQLDKKQQYFDARGELYLKIRQNKKAIDDYTKAIQLDNKQSQYYHKRGSAKYYLKDYKGAIQDYTQAINLHPAERYYQYRANAYQRIGEVDLCKIDRKKAKKTIYY